MFRFREGETFFCGVCNKIEFLHYQLENRPNSEQDSKQRKRNSDCISLTFRQNMQTIRDKKFTNDRKEPRTAQDPLIGRKSIGTQYPERVGKLDEDLLKRFTR